MESKTENSSGIRSAREVAKAGLLYTICDFLMKGMAFITTPIFARLLTKAEMGYFTNYSSWASILLILASFELSQSIIRSKLEFEKDIDSYIWSILAFSSLWTLLLYGVFCLFPAFFSDLFQIDVKYIHLLFVYLFVSPAYSMLITKHRAFFKYKTFTLLTMIFTISGLLLSLLMVILMEDKLAGRILGLYLPHILMGFGIYVYLVAKGKTIKTDYWKYACRICLPLVPHVMSLYLLSQSDKIIITRICGKEYTAIYGIAYSAYHIVTILFHSMNKAWAPWLLECLHHKKYEEVRKASKVYIGIFFMLVVGILILIPEIIFILGGKQYASAIYCLPPLIASCVFQFIYTMYVNIEFYLKKTVGVSVATMIAAGINIALNLIFIPMNREYGYVIAAYTTLVGYIVLFIIHYGMVRKMNMDHVYDIKYIVLILLGTLVISGIMNVLYGLSIWLRYGITLLYGGVVLYVVYRQREIIKRLLKKN